MYPKRTISCAFLLVLAILVAAEAKPSLTTSTTTPSFTEKSLPKPKRSLSAFVGDAALAGNPFAASGPWVAGVTGARFTNGQWPIAAGSYNPWNSYSSRLYSAPSPTEVANAIAAAKQASANVLISQQQMQAAKENVLNQQRIAMEKETAAAILTQKSEAAAAIQRSEASAAAQAVVLAQQRLAASKAAVAHQQRIASAKEAEAAAALQRSAHAAAAEIQKTEYEAAKFGQYTRNGNAGAAHHLTLTKDTAFSPITAGNNHVPGFETFGPWSGHVGAGKSSSGGPWL